MRDAFTATPFDSPLEVSYAAEARDDPSVAAHKILHWLGIRNVLPPRDPPHSGPSPFDRCTIRQLVSNQPELHRFLDGTAWAWMLEIDREATMKSPRKLLGIVKK
jgi:hypothetical protein